MSTPVWTKHNTNPVVLTESEWEVIEAGAISDTVFCWKDALIDPPKESGEYLAILNYGTGWFDAMAIEYDATRNLWNCSEDSDSIDNAFPRGRVVSWAAIVWPTEEESPSYYKAVSDNNKKDDEVI